MYVSYLYKTGGSWFTVSETYTAAQPVEPGDDGPVLVRLGVDATWVVEDGGRRWASDATWQCLVDKRMATRDMTWPELSALPDNPGGSYQCDEYEATDS